MATPRRFPLAVIFATVFVDLVGFGIVIPVLPLYAERFGASPLTVGLLLGIYSAMQFIFAPLLGKLSDRVGRRPVLLLSMIGTAAGFLLMGLAGRLWLLFVARVIDGVTGGNISTAQAYIADVTPPHQRSRGMGLIGAAFGLGFIFGPAIGGLLSRFSLGAPFLFAAALAAVNSLCVWLFLPESLDPAHRHQAKRRASILEIFQGPAGRSLGIVIATYFFTTVAFSLLTATYPLFTERRFGYGASQNGLIFACLGTIGAVVQGGLLGILLRLSGDKGLTLAGTAILAASFLALPLTATTAALLLATAGFAVGHSFVVATLNGLASKEASPASQGRVLGVMQSVSSLARVVGPVAGGWLLNLDVAGGVEAAHRIGPFGAVPYWTAAGVTAVAILLAAAL
ncbi:MAG: MFS transporter [Candidatus Omnitrophica bacterium]|nr:MFS transporter [Candidatus Omnitrophota bacterium]